MNKNFLWLIIMTVSMLSIMVLTFIGYPQVTLTAWTLWLCSMFLWCNMLSIWHTLYRNHYMIAYKVGLAYRWSNKYRCQFDVILFSNVLELQKGEFGTKYLLLFDWDCKCMLFLFVRTSERETWLIINLLIEDAYIKGFICNSNLFKYFLNFILYYSNLACHMYFAYCIMFYVSLCKM